MADAKISALSEGTSPQDTDLFGLARGAGNVKLLWSALKLGMPFTLIASQLRATDGGVDFTSIPQTYSHLLLISVARSNYAGGQWDILRWRFNNDSATNYYGTNAQSKGGTVVGFATSGRTAAPGPVITSNTETVGRAGYGFTLIPFYTNTNFQKVCLSISGFSYLEASANVGEMDFIVGNWTSTSAITRVTNTYELGTALMTGSHVKLYGIL